MDENGTVKVNRIADVLYEKKISQKELASRLNKSKQVINRYCRNAAQPSLSYLREIALVIGVNAQELIEPTPTREK